MNAASYSRRKNKLAQRLQESHGEERETLLQGMKDAKARQREYERRGRRAKEARLDRQNELDSPASEREAERDRLESADISDTAPLLFRKGGLMRLHPSSTKLTR